MQQLTTVWSNLDPRRRVIVALATAAMFAAVLGLSRMAAQPDMALLYAGLDGPAAGDVIAALEQQGAVYQIRGDAIFVASARRDALRMTLAGEGLPANGVAGYELLDSLSGFGTTSQMFDAAYWRAKEGELARTILANPQIRAARVHIAAATGQPFRRDLRPSAAVTVTTQGGTLAPAQARALMHLVAASVPGMTPEDVSVIDDKGGLILAGDPAPGIDAGDRAAQLRANAERLLAARMGPGRAVVEVTVDTVTDSESILERRFDPEGRVAISTDTEERNNSASDTGAAAVTVASNLPEGDAAGGQSSSSTGTETRERVNYEVSETQREVTRGPGAIRRLSVAVLLDGIHGTDAAGNPTWQPLPDEELASLEALVASAVGLDPARGDVITLRSMQFEPLSGLGTVAEAGLLASLHLDAMALIQLAVLATVLLLLGLFVLRPILAGRASAPAAPALAAPATASVAGTEALTGEIDDGPLPDGRMSLVGGDSDATTAPPEADPVDRLRRMIEDRREETVQILRHWMEEDEEPA